MNVRAGSKKVQQRQDKGRSWRSFLQTKYGTVGVSQKRGNHNSQKHTLEAYVQKFTFAFRTE